METEQIQAFSDEALEAALSPRNFVTEGDCMFAKGTKIGEFEIVSRLGNSGLGETYLVRSVVSRKRFAMKVLPAAADADPTFHARFDELRAKVQDRIHPHIVHVRKMDRHSDGVLTYCYIVMDYVESSLGRPCSLKDMLKNGVRLSDAKTLKIALQICDAMEYACGCEGGPYFHSDLKPSNILFDMANLVKLSDFDVIALIGRSYVKDAVRHCVNKAHIDQWSGEGEGEGASVVSQAAIRLPGTPVDLDETEAHILLDSPSKFSLADFGLTRFVKSDYMRQLLDRLPMGRGRSSKGQGEGGVPGKLSDTKALHRDPGRRGSPTGLNAINGILDTYDFMSPEQKAGAEPDIRSGVYTIGLLLYRMLTGRKMGVCWDLPSKYGARAAWDKIVVKCLKMEPEDRYASIAELREDLMTTRAKGPGVKPMMYAGFALAVVSLSFGLLWDGGLTSKLSSVFFKKSAAPVGVSKTFPMTIDVEPSGASLKVYRSGVLLASVRSCPPGGFRFQAEKAVYGVLAEVPGGGAVWREFEAAPSLVFDVEIPRLGEAFRYQSVKGLVQPKPGFPWKAEELKISFVPISSPAPGSDRKGLESVVKPFWISASELGQWSYEKIMRANPSEFPGADDAPIERISLSKAMEFCKRFTDFEREAGRLPDGYIYRLPTEAEWLYCARAGSTAHYCFGDDAELLPEYAWFGKDSSGSTHQSAKLKPNRWGVYDVHGNVWEYCADIIKTPHPENPSISVFHYIAKGGSWDSTPDALRFDAKRDVEAIDKVERNIGVRVLLAPPVEAPIVDRTGPQVPRLGGR